LSLYSNVFARAKAKVAGVKEIYIEDLREEFARDFVFPMFRANAIYEGEYLLGTSINFNAVLLCVIH
jgi:argininosuccinate synthase